MSDFLKNLVGRSRGTLQAVRPRVPSVYEPHREGSGLLGTQPGLSTREAEPALESGLDAEANAPFTDPRAASLRTRSARDGQSAEFAADGQPAEGVQIPDPAAQAPPSLTPRLSSRPETIAGIQVSGRHDPMSESNASPLAPSATFEPILLMPTGRPAGATLVAAASSDNRVNRSEGIHPPAKSQVITKLGIEPHARPDSLKTETSMHAIRPPEAPRSGSGKNSETSAASAPSQPSIQVLIGRVEVRAVFPEPAVRRAPLPRSRPTVSLDDYLNQRHGGKR